MRIKEGDHVKSIARAIAGLVLITALFNLPSAQANTLVATSPIAGSTLKAGPSAVTITTELPLIDEGNDIIVTDPTGKRVDTGILTVLGTEAVAEMKPLVTSGIYTVTYMLLAEADLPLEGSFTFNYSAIVLSTPTPTATAAPEPITSTPAQPTGSNFATNLFVIFLLGLSVLVLIGMGAYARKIFKER
jgi:methionine-rich copper-binding protein CopC